MSGAVLVSLMLIFNIFHTLFYVAIINFEHVIAGWLYAHSFSKRSPLEMLERVLKTSLGKILNELDMLRRGAIH